MPRIRTVLGDIAPEQIGQTFTHEHVRYAYHGALNDHRTLWDFEATAHKVGTELKKWKDDFAIASMVDMTTLELGRHPELIAEVSRRSGMHIICTTGFFPEVAGMGIPFHFRRQSVEYLAEFFERDITEGMVYDGKLTPYKAGILKAAIGGLGPKYPSPRGSDGKLGGDFERLIIAALARAQRKLGCAIGTHTQPADHYTEKPGIQLLDLLEAGGADPGKIIVGHGFVHPHIDELKEVCQRGANLQIDHIGIPWQNDSRESLDELIANAVCELADAGYLDRLVFSYDSFLSQVRGPVTEEAPLLLNELVPTGYLFTHFAPRLAQKGFGAQELRAVLVDNPQRLLAF